jgi:hypothetical protein
MQGQQLLTESQVFDDEVFPRTKSRDNPSEDIPEHDHGKNLIGTVGIETFAKSLILRVYDVLARHSQRDLRLTQRAGEPRLSGDVGGSKRGLRLRGMLGGGAPRGQH